MIGKVKGILSEIDHNTGIIDTAGGVGYLLFLSPRILSHYKLNDQISLYTYLQVREDAQVLFGFETKEEYAFFKILLTVPGVGPKTAYTVISYAKTDELINAVKQNDIAYFSHIPGLGKKTSMKIILELSQKIKSEFKINEMYLSDDDKTVIDALVSLGYKQQEAKKIFAKLPKQLTIEEKIKEALKQSEKYGKK